MLGLEKGAESGVTAVQEELPIMTSPDQLRRLETLGEDGLADIVTYITSVK